MENHGKFTLQWDKLAAIVKVGLPMAIQMVVVNTAYLLVAGMLNQFGTCCICCIECRLANQHLCWYALLGYWTGSYSDGRAVHESWTN